VPLGGPAIDLERELAGDLVTHRKERGTTLSQLELQVEGKGSLPDSVAAHWRDCLGAWATANAKLVFYNADSSIVKPKVL
jgi:hypothetical protein